MFNIKKIMFEVILNQTNNFKACYIQCLPFFFTVVFLTNWAYTFNIMTSKLLSLCTRCNSTSSYTEIHYCYNLNVDISLTGRDMYNIQKQLIVVFKVTLKKMWHTLWISDIRLSYALKWWTTEWHFLMRSLADDGKERRS